MSSQGKEKLPIFVCIKGRDGHAEADDAEVCGLMRICGSVAEDKICMRHSRQKKQGQK